MTLLSHMTALARGSGAASVLIGGGPQADLKDPVAGAGPVASLCALAESPLLEIVSQRWVVVPVDMPLLEPALLRRLAATTAPAAAFAGHPLPLALTLGNDARTVLARTKARLMAHESVAVWQVLELLGSLDLTATESETAQLINANTPDEWSRLNDRP